MKRAVLANVPNLYHTAVGGERTYNNIIQVFRFLLALVMTRF